jgi:hypothetical protein
VFSLVRAGAVLSFYPGVQFPVNDQTALAELYRATYPEFNVDPNVQLQADAAAKLLGEIGPSVLLTTLRKWSSRLVDGDQKRQCQGHHGL